MGIATIDSTDFDVFGTVALADAYLLGSISPNAVAWRAAVADTRARGLIESTRLLLEEGLVLTDGVTPVTIANAPDGVLNAAYELAAALVKTPSLSLAANTGKNIESVGAGSAQVTFFGPEDGSRFPPTIERLLAPFRPDATSAEWPGGSRSSGTGACSDFPDDYSLNGGQ